MDTYRAPLAIAYLLAPALAAGAGAAVFELSESDALAITAGGLMLTLPAAVHAYHADTERALVSFGSMLGVTVIGAAVFAGLGYLLGDASCERGTPEYEAEGCGIEIEAMTLVGAGAGAVIGYVSYGIYDVIGNASVPAAQSGSANATALRLWISPVVNTTRREELSTPITGGQLGGTVQF